MSLRASLQHQRSQLPISDDVMSVFAPYGVMSWRTASGRLVAHTVYSLLGCPPLRSAVYMLVRRSGSGQRSVLAVGRTQRVAATVNLARIRHFAANLGANEVHVHMVGGADSTRAALERDLALAHLN